jgi:hypothetical protein
MFTEGIAVYCGNHKKHKSTLCVQNAGFSMLKPVVQAETIELYGVKKVWYSYSMWTEIKLNWLWTGMSN